MLSEENKTLLNKLNSDFSYKLFVERLDLTGCLISFILSVLFSYLYGPLAFVVGCISVAFRFVTFDIDKSNTLKQYNQIFQSNGFEKATIYETKNGNRVSIPIWKIKDTPLTDVYIKRQFG